MHKWPVNTRKCAQSHPLSDNCKLNAARYHCPPTRRPGIKKTTARATEVFVGLKYSYITSGSKICHVLFGNPLAESEHLSLPGMFTHIFGSGTMEWMHLCTERHGKNGLSVCSLQPQTRYNLNVYPHNHMFDTLICMVIYTHAYIDMISMYIDVYAHMKWSSTY